MTRTLSRAYWKTTEVMKPGRPKCASGAHKRGRLDMAEVEGEDDQEMEMGETRMAMRRMKARKVCPFPMPAWL